VSERLADSTRLQPLPESRYSAQEVFAFVHKCVLVCGNTELFECPISKLNQASLPLWEHLRPKEIMEWELLTEHLKDRELN
jgi:hypothetical protein